jgi:acyl transferase domain-containing protein/NAD(P)H-dependent flavin oxidoreductase YrpB (nitropropane dioxygenase family)/NAD(P)-dependent dehydrogenase (short-subunit alcohol dehydrogenase family)
VLGVEVPAGIELMGLPLSGTRTDDQMSAEEDLPTADLLPGLDWSERELIVPDFLLVALTPPAMLDPSIAIAASRAGALGVLDLEFANDERAAQHAIDKLARHARKPCGVKLAGGAEQLTSEVLNQLPDAVGTILLTPDDPENLLRHVHALHSQSRRVLLEATSLAEASLGEDAGVDGLIAKGHEAGGRVGETTAFVLLQQLLGTTQLPVWCQGGIGLHTAAACYAAGAAGAVLDVQLALTRESSMPEATRAALAKMDGSETICLGQSLGAGYRVYHRPGLPVVQELRVREATLAAEPTGTAEARYVWRREIQARAGWDAPDRLWLVGQDGAFAASLTSRYRTVGSVLHGIREAIDTSVRVARRLQSFDEGSPLASSHETRYPILQGPMTRVSDTAAFADEVARAGGLPFLALALMRAAEARALLEETSRVLGDRPWGVGILGFVESDLRQEQLALIRDYRPKFALIAGGRPDQALDLERDGISSYLHVPSPGLLRLFLANGARRVVFEGRECGGHVGPRSSFVLWNTMIDVLLDTLTPEELAKCHVVFAGGIHDATSSAMVATMAAPLAERGARIGALLGTAYLFTEEAVRAGAITEGFQREALRCERTVLLETGVGHATRCAETPYVATFEQERARLTAKGATPEESRATLEQLNLGRLRAASKAVVRTPSDGRASGAPSFTNLSEQEQRAQGMYMMGQVAGLRDTISTIAQLHEAVSAEGSRLLSVLPTPALSDRAKAPAQSSAIAIVGMACILPKAPNLQTYWQNILDKVDAITEVPPSRWDWRRWFDPDPTVPDKVYSKWGGFVDDWPFDPLRYGIAPSSLPSIEPLQLLAIETVNAALEDAGYHDRPFPRERTSVILGVGGGAGDLGQQYAVRSELSGLPGSPPPEIWTRLPEWTEDSFPGILLNVTAGRIANRFDLGGVNYTVDAACASSLAAVYLAVQELEAGTSDVVIVGGADTVQNPFAFLCFSKTHALSPRGRCRTFDESADGIAISEGTGVLVLKRLQDAERDGDRVYAVIKGVAGSSDGRGKGLTAPRPEGQAVALERAYTKAGVSPATVKLIEAHGTGTVAGDQAEVATLKRVFEAAGASRQGCAIGSVKSMIGHTKCTAGVASMIKGALALHHKVLPPTMHVDQPNPGVGFDESPFHVNTELRPWLSGDPAAPRRAGVSAFGFGGTNFHVVLEEYASGVLDADGAALTHDWPNELLVWAAATPGELLEKVQSLAAALDQGATPRLRDLACTLWGLATEEARLRLALVVSSLDDLREKLAAVRQALAADAQAELDDPRGIFYAAVPLAREGRTAFLFPGQGSQYPGMLQDLAIRFPEVRERFELADQVLADRFPQGIGSLVFPPPCFGPEEQAAREQALTRTDAAQPALGAADLAMLQLLESLRVRPDMVGGHSYGEYVALCTAGCLTEPALYTLSEARGRCIVESRGQDPGAMAAIAAGADEVEQALSSLEDVWLANINGPRQTVIAGTQAGIERAVERLDGHGIGSRALQVACAFHSPLVGPARDRLADVLAGVELAAPRMPVFSNTSAAPYPDDPQQIIALLADHLVKPVRFAAQVDAMYQAGARVFVEVGPRNVLTGLVAQVLGSRPHLAVACDVHGRPGLLQLQHAIGQLYAHGAQLDLGQLHRGRDARRLDMAALVEQTAEPSLSPSTWLVNGGTARPLYAPPVHAAAADMSPNGAEAGLDVVVSTTPEAAPRSVGQAPLAHPAATESGGLDGDIPVGEEGSEVMRHFQRLMSKFLDTQQQVMLAYMNGAADGPPLLLQPSNHLAVHEQPGLPEQRSGPPHDAAQVLPVADAAESWTPSAAASHAHHESGIAGSGQVNAPSVPDAGQLAAQLIDVFSERTGYPPEVLNLDLNIEADLSCDSIKRVEIIGTFLRGCLPAGTPHVPAIMEALTGVKTLRGIIDVVSTFMSPNAAASPEGVSTPAPTESGKAIGPAAAQREPAVAVSAERSDDVNAPRPVDAVSPIGDAVVPRWVPTLVDAPASGVSPPIAGRAFIVTDDERGTALPLASELRSLGAQVAVIRLGSVVAETGTDLYTADLADPAAADEVVRLVRGRLGPLAGIIHLLPLREGALPLEGDVAGWLIRVGTEVTSLFNLAKATGHDLRQAAAVGGAWVVAVTGMGGGFGLDGTRETVPATHGGVAGLIKTLAHEWPQVSHEIIDLAPDSSPEEAARCILAELASGDEVEVGYLGKRRVVPRLHRAPLDQLEQPGMNLDSDSVILVTGGARGITAEVCRKLADHYRPTLVLVGRSPLPPPDEAPDTAGLTAEADLKRALIVQARRQGKPVEPARIEATYSALLQARTIRENMAAMRAAGAKLDYRSVDVRDYRAFGRLIEELYTLYGRLDGVIHGAGVIEDSLIEDKTLESFTRVIETKLIGALVLGSSVHLDSLQFFVLFSSVAGLFGNRGQGDYAAANEMLNKLALSLDRRSPGRIASMNWGPWLRTGMASEAVQRQFLERNVSLIPPRAGSGLLLDELRLGVKGDVEVVIGDGPWPVASEPEQASPSPWPLLGSMTLRRSGDGSVGQLCELDPGVHRYLEDHRLDGKPVLPAAVALELMTELVQLGWPQWQVAGVRDLRVLKGLVFNGGSKTLRIAASPRGESSPAGIEIEVAITDPMSPGMRHYRAIVELAAGLPEVAGVILPPGPAAPAQAEVTAAEAYRRYLFHGPRFQCITGIEWADKTGIAGMLLPSTPAACIDGEPRGSWLIDPIVVDGGAQLAIVLSRLLWNMTPLPAGFGSYRRFRPLSGGPIRCRLQVLPDSTADLLLVDVYFTEPGGRLLGLMQRLELILSPALNRLVGVDR